MVIVFNRMQDKSTHQIWPGYEGGFDPHNELMRVVPGLGARPPGACLTALASSLKGHDMYHTNYGV